MTKYVIPQWSAVEMQAAMDLAMTETTLLQLGAVPFAGPKTQHGDFLPVGGLAEAQRSHDEAAKTWLPDDGVTLPHSVLRIIGAPIPEKTQRPAQVQWAASAGNQKNQNG